jgi:hypothetical protein
MEYAIWKIELSPEITVGLFSPEVYHHVNGHVMDSKINSK